MKIIPRKCVWIYHYFDHPVFGFGHVRLQTWLPMNVFICLNGRHWLEKQMSSNRMGYLKDENTFPWIADIPRAQELMNEQLKSNWSAMLGGLLFDTCPDIGGVLMPLEPDYYWSADDTEWATDVMFRKASDLERIFPSLIRNAMLISDSPAVMRYFGKRNVTASGKCSGKLPQEVISDYRSRFEGVRVKHWLNKNSVKVYDKQGSVLRFETTITNTRDFKVFRHPNDDESRPASWQRMRKGVCDLHRRCQVSDNCNTRYADTIAASLVADTLKETVQDVCNPVVKKGKRSRGLNPWNTEDYQVLTFLARGEWAINGFRNKDLRNHLYPFANKNNQKQLSGRISRRIRMLRMHGLIRKVPRENRYVLTQKGRKYSAALMSASSSSIQQLMESSA
ncbi:hypothetical protein BVY04_04120 [bacterium M21]|nr:hypothetical protein BVY04_04120 [bacterium M21]